MTVIVGFLFAFARVLSTYPLSTGVALVLASWAVSQRLARVRIGIVTVSATLCVVAAFALVVAALEFTGPRLSSSPLNATDATLLLSPLIALPTLHFLLAE